MPFLNIADSGGSDELPELASAAAPRDLNQASDSDPWSRWASFVPVNGVPGEPLEGFVARLEGPFESEPKIAQCSCSPFLARSAHLSRSRTRRGPSAALRLLSTFLGVGVVPRLHIHGDRLQVDGPRSHGASASCGSRLEIRLHCSLLAGPLTWVSRASSFPLRNFLRFFGRRPASREWARKPPTGPWPWGASWRLAASLWYTAGAADPNAAGLRAGRASAGRPRARPQRPHGEVRVPFQALVAAAVFVLPPSLCCATWASSWAIRASPARVPGRYSRHRRRRAHRPRTPWR